MIPTLTTAQAESPEDSGELARLYQIDLPSLQSHNLTGSISIRAVPSRPDIWGELASARNQILQLRLNAQLLRQALVYLRADQSRAIGLREMHFDAADVAELRKHIEHPTALPRIPVQRIAEEDPGELE